MFFINYIFLFLNRPLNFFLCQKSIANIARICKIVLCLYWTFGIKEQTHMLLVRCLTWLKMFFFFFSKIVAWTIQSFWMKFCERSLIEKNKNLICLLVENRFFLTHHVAITNEPAQGNFVWKRSVTCSKFLPFFFQSFSSFEETTIHFYIDLDEVAYKKKLRIFNQLINLFF